MCVGAGRERACVLLMSGAAVNDSIRLFLNALVTPMGHPAGECAHSAEQALAWHQGHTNILQSSSRLNVRLFVCYMSELDSLTMSLRRGNHLFIKATICYAIILFLHYSS